MRSSELKEIEAGRPPAPPPKKRPEPSYDERVRREVEAEFRAFGARTWTGDPMKWCRGERRIIP